MCHWKRLEVASIRVDMIQVMLQTETRHSPWAISPRRGSPTLGTPGARASTNASPTAARSFSRSRRPARSAGVQIGQVRGRRHTVGLGGYPLNEEQVREIAKSDIERRGPATV